MEKDYRDKVDLARKKASESDVSIATKDRERIEADDEKARKGGETISDGKCFNDGPELRSLQDLLKSGYQSDSGTPGGHTIVLPRPKD